MFLCRQLKSKSQIQWHHWKAEFQGFHLTPSIMGLQFLMMKIWALKKKAQGLLAAPVYNGWLSRLYGGWPWIFGAAAQSPKMDFPTLGLTLKWFRAGLGLRILDFGHGLVNKPPSVFLILYVWRLLSQNLLIETWRRICPRSFITEEIYLFNTQNFYESTLIETRYSQMTTLLMSRFLLNGGPTNCIKLTSSQCSQS